MTRAPCLYWQELSCIIILMNIYLCVFQDVFCSGWGEGGGGLFDLARLQRDHLVVLRLVLKDRHNPEPLHPRKKQVQEYFHSCIIHASGAAVADTRLEGAGGGCKTAARTEGVTTKHSGSSGSRTATRSPLTARRADLGSDLVREAEGDQAYKPILF